MTYIDDFKNPREFVSMIVQDKKTQENIIVCDYVLCISQINEKRRRAQARVHNLWLVELDIDTLHSWDSKDNSITKCPAVN